MLKTNNRHKHADGLGRALMPLSLQFEPHVEMQGLHLVFHTSPKMFLPVKIIKSMVEKSISIIKIRRRGQSSTLQVCSQSLNPLFNWKVALPYNSHCSVHLRVAYFLIFPRFLISTSLNVLWGFYQYAKKNQVHYDAIISW